MSGRVREMNKRLSIVSTIETLWLVLASVSCYTADPRLEAILRNSARPKQIVASQGTASQSAITLSTPSIVAGTAMTWTNGTQTWAGNPFCATLGKLLRAESPAVEGGTLIPGFHCPKPGSALHQPRMSNGDYCQEWYGSSPDIGSCEYVP